eukprot:7486984-Pyramimonas_sp.AAC.1
MGAVVYRRCCVVYTSILVHASTVVYAGVIAHAAAAIYAGTPGVNRDVVLWCTRLLWYTEALVYGGSAVFHGDIGNCRVHED